MNELSQQQISAVSGGNGTNCHCSDGAEVQVGPTGIVVNTATPTMGQDLYDTWAGLVDATSRIGEDSGIFPTIQSASDAIGSAHDSAVNTVSRWMEAATTSFLRVDP